MIAIIVFFLIIASFHYLSIIKGLPFRFDFSRFGLVRFRFGSGLIAIFFIVDSIRFDFYSRNRQEIGKLYTIDYIINSSGL